MTPTTTSSRTGDAGTEHHPANAAWTPRPWASVEAAPAASATASPVPHERPQAWVAPSHAPAVQPAPVQVAAPLQHAFQEQVHAALIPLHPQIAPPTQHQPMVPAAAHPVAVHHAPISRVVPPLSQRDGVVGLLFGLIVLAIPVAGALSMGLMRDAPKAATATTAPAPAAPTGVTAPADQALAAGDPAAGGAVPTAPGTTPTAAPAGQAAPAAPAPAAATKPAAAARPTAAARGGAARSTAPTARAGGATSSTGSTRPTIGGGAHASAPSHAAPTTSHAAAPQAGVTVVHPHAAPPAATPAPAPQVAVTPAAPTSWTISTPGGAKFDIHSQGELDQVKAQMPNATIVPH
jgi:hypothetical protein